MDGVSIKLGHCKCGWGLQLYKTDKGAWTYCFKRKWYNFWKHDKKVQHSYFA